MIETDSVIKGDIHMSNLKLRAEIVADFREKLETNKSWALHGLVTLFNKQTEDEQCSDYTRHVNGCGFNSFDAKKLSGIAKWYLEKGFVTNKQLQVVQSKIGKYAGQLVDHGVSIGKIKTDGKFYIL